MKIAKALISSLLFLTPIMALTACSSNASITVTESTLIIDTRSFSEYAAGHIESALNIDFSQQDSLIKAKLAGISRSGTYVVYGSDGQIVSKAYKMMKDYGFNSVVNAGSVDSAAQSLGLSLVSR